MRDIWVYKQNKTGAPIPAARVEFVDGGVRVTTVERGLKQLLISALRQDALVESRIGLTVKKRAPRDLEEAISARLKRNVPRPYFLSRDAGEIPTPESTFFVPGDLFQVEELQDAAGH